MTTSNRNQSEVRDGLLATILSEEAYRPIEPDSIKDTGLPTSLIESLIFKRLSMVGIESGRKLAEFICIPFRLLEPILHEMRSRQNIVHRNSAPLNDYNYALTEQGNDRARIAMDACAYVGAAPVPLMEYVLSAEAQSIRAESPRREDLRDAFEEITINEDLFENLGPAINSGAGLFLYGEPGNGKSTLAKRITQCFGQDVWIPRVIIEDGQLIKFYDAAVHEVSTSNESSIVNNASYDKRWVKIRRPTVIVGGELTMDSLEIRYDQNSNVSEAPLQMKSNCGCLLIDDFGRQRIDPVELLNRWIVPLEARYDFLTLSTGKKIQVPFEQLIIFSTNLDPEDLVDEAFLRRIPYKIEIGDPSVDEFHELFELYADIFDCDYRPDVVDYLIEKHYVEARRPMRRCHPRDLLQQIQNFCSYNELNLEMRDDYFDRVVKSYFSVVIAKNDVSWTDEKNSPKAPSPLDKLKSPRQNRQEDATVTQGPTPTSSATLAPTPTCIHPNAPTPTSAQTIAPTPTKSHTIAPTPTSSPTIAPTPTSAHTIAPTPTMSATAAAVEESSSQPVPSDLGAEQPFGQNTVAAEKFFNEGQIGENTLAAQKFFNEAEAPLAPAPVASVPQVPLPPQQTVPPPPGRPAVQAPIVAPLAPESNVPSEPAPNQP